MSSGVSSGPAIAILESCELDTATGPQRGDRAAGAPSTAGEHPQDLFTVSLELLRADAADARKFVERSRLHLGHLGERGVVEDDVGRQVVRAGDLGAPCLQRREAFEPGAVERARWRLARGCPLAGRAALSPSCR